MSALAKLSLGTLSEREAEIAEAAPDSIAPELREQLLYQHLFSAAQARLRMDAAKSWSAEYHRDFLARENALKQARHHYAVLGSMGPIDPLLAEMATREGLLP